MLILLGQCKVIIDAHSKWIEVFPTSSATSSAVVEVLRSIFVRFGIPEMIVSDNGPCLVSEEFEFFLRANGVKHVTSAPYHPSTNGLAERAIQILKKEVTDGTIHSRLAKVLMSYRITPQSTTGSSTAELLLGRQPRTRLDLLKPSPEVSVEHKQVQQKIGHDRKAKARVFQTGSLVYARNFGSGHTWIPGQIVERSGPVSFMVKCSDGNLVRRHQDQLRHRTSTCASESVQSSPDVWIDVSPDMNSQAEPDSGPDESRDRSESSSEPLSESSSDLSSESSSQRVSSNRN